MAKQDESPIRVDGELIARKSADAASISHAIKVAAQDAVLDIDDFDEGVALGTDALPPGMPTEMRGKGGDMVRVVPVRICKATCTQHKLWPWALPITPDNAPDVPRRYFNLAGELQMGDLLVCVVSRDIIKRLKDKSREALAASVKKWDMGGTDYGEDKGPVEDVFGGKRFSGGVRIKSARELER